MAAPCFWVFGPPDAAVLALVESGETLSKILSTYYASKLGSSSSSSSSNSSSSSDSSGNAKRAVLGSLALLAAGLAYRQFSGGGNRGEDRGGGAPPPSAAAAPTPAPAHKKKVSQHPQREREREREGERERGHTRHSLQCAARRAARQRGPDALARRGGARGRARGTGCQDAREEGEQNVRCEVWERGEIE